MKVKMESMLAQLIKMAGSLQSDMQETKRERQEMKKEQKEMKIRTVRDESGAARVEGLPEK